jgi:hypothetical protein
LARALSAPRLYATGEQIIAVIGIDIGKILRRAVPAYSEITWSSRWLCSAFA